MVRIATWQEMLAGRPEKQNTNIIVLGDNGVLYGHELVRDIAEGRKDAEDVTIFSRCPAGGISGSSFCAVRGPRMRPGVGRT
jgi:hypothetical protein